MPRKSQKTKRPTQPKIKGCYECSQRRISCDRGEPECIKCLSRGLKCSGLGVRYRFENGVASRGKFVGKTARDICRDNSGQRIEINETRKDCDTGLVRISSRCRLNKIRDARPTTPVLQLSSVNTDHALFGGKSSQLANCASPMQIIGVSAEFQVCTGVGPHIGLFLSFDRFETIPGWKQSFITYFSMHIAPYMLSIDDSSNGWRELILPIAFEDEVVMDAVITASAYHISANSETALSLGPSSYTKAISGLMKKQDFKSLKPLINGFSVIAILVLLTSAMVTGCDDFPIMFKMLKSAFEVMMKDGGSGDKNLDDFLHRQVNKIRTYGEPMVSELSGIETISTKALQSFDCLQHCMLQHPEHSLSLKNVRSQIEQAYHIYLRRALGELNAQISIQLVEQFKRTAELYEGTAPGHHVLIWATFIVACESSTPEHQDFLIERLKTFHSMSRFDNNLKAIALLKTIWNNTSGSRWTAFLPTMRILIM